ncbi:MAG: prepilin-type N-terminal cleavage/methylation domain-containing protein [Armatimonadetes bacterium]|nr:prepilin-type N-terminal cleavage/methylation domain-containing protein [Armatimonadota bacterium]
MKKAFTLIELLVVIAIIAILAAILFPVFAQAKLAAKKTQGISNLKQVGTANMIYMADYDDLMPNGWSVRADNTHRWSTLHPAPATAVLDGWEDPVIQSQIKSAWAEAIQPYIKNWEMMNAPGQSAAGFIGTPSGTYAAPVGITFNGLLSNYSATAVVQQSTVPMFWTGGGNQFIPGRSMSNPSLRCDSTGPCVFNPAGHPQTGASTGANHSAFFLLGTKVWTYGDGRQSGGGGVIIARTDSSTKFQRAGTAIDPSVHQTAATDPYARITTTGFSYWATTDDNCDTAPLSTAGSRYVCFFRPDRRQ